METRPPNTNRWLLPAALLTGLFVRVVCQWQYGSSIFWGDYSVDEQLHNAWAKYIASGHLVGDAAYFRAPLYPYFLALLYAISDANMHVVFAVQHLIGLVTGWLLYRLCSEMFSETIGLIALCIYVLTPTFPYFENQLLLDFLILPFVLSGLLFLHRALLLRKRSHYVIAGIFFGLSAITRPNTLLFVCGAIAWLLVSQGQRANLRQAAKNGAFYALGVASVIAPVTIRNLAVSGDFVLISSQGGLNFYLGNNDRADGISAYMPGFGASWDYSDCRAVAENAEGRVLSDSEVSGYWLWQGIRFALDQPDRYLPLMLKKFYLLFNNHDVSNNRSIPYVYNEIWVLRILPLGIWLLLPAAIVGAVAGRRNSRVVIVALFVAAYSASVVLFFVNSRFRLPVILGLIPLSAFGINAAVGLYREKFRRLLYVTGAISALISLLTLSNFYGIDFDNRGQEEYNLGNRSRIEGRFSEALERYRASAHARPDMSEVNLNIGVTFLNLGRLDSAETYFYKELTVTEDSAEAFNNLGVVAGLSGGDSLALSFVEEAVRRKPQYFDAVINYVIHARRLGRIRDALAVVDSSIRVSEPNAYLRFYRGVLLFDAGDLESAQSEFELSRGMLKHDPQPSFTSMSDIQSPRESAERRTATDAMIDYHLGTIAGRRGQLDSARVILSRALEGDSTLVEAKINLASALTLLGQFDEALRLTQEIIESGNSNALVWYLEGFCRMNLGLPGVIPALDSAITVNPEYVPALRLRQSLQK
jgi:tetratricopeptide (TPR) repeat protein